MKALVWRGPEQMAVDDVPEPEPEPGSAILAVGACGICGSELEGYLGHMDNRVPPLVMGHEFSGTVLEVGDAADEEWQGRLVTVNPIESCGRCALCRSGLDNVCPTRTLIGIHHPGAFAERVRVPVANLRALPAGTSSRVGALAEPFANGVHALRLLGRDGDDVLTGGGGPDTVQGDDDNGRLNGGLGDDRLEGGAGVDTLRGDNFNDFLDGGFGADTLFGGPGVDRLFGGGDNDVIFSKEEPGELRQADTVFCGGGFDSVIADLLDDVDIVFTKQQSLMGLGSCEEAERSPVGETPHVRLPRKTLDMSRAGVARVRLSCPERTTIGSRGTLSLTLAGRGAKRPARTEYSIRAGRSETVSVRLSAAEAPRARGGLRGILTSVERGRLGRKTTTRSPRSR